MWTKIYPVMWVSVKVKEKKPFSLSFPVPLHILDELIDSTLDLFTVLHLFAPRSSAPKITSGENKSYFSPEAIKILLESTHTILHSLKGYGPYELADVTAKDVRVQIKIL